MFFVSFFLFQEISPRGKRRLEFRQEKPFKGLTFYLDLQGYRKTSSLQARIKELGGVRNLYVLARKTVQHGNVTLSQAVLETYSYMITTCCFDLFLISVILERLG